MKKVIILSSALLLGVATVFAQSEKPVERNKKLDTPNAKKEKFEVRKEAVKNKNSEMDEVVGFSEKQKIQLKEINKVSSEKMREVRVKYKDQEDKTEMRAEMKELQQERMAKTRSIMNEEQKTKWRAHQKSKNNTAPKQE